MNTNCTINRMLHIDPRLIQDVLARYQRWRTGETAVNLYEDVVARLHEEWLSANPEPAVDHDDDASVQAWDLWHTAKEAPRGTWCPVCRRFCLDEFSSNMDILYDHVVTCPLVPAIGLAPKATGAFPLRWIG